jgi:hypothetical protein
VRSASAFEPHGPEADLGERHDGHDAFTDPGTAAVVADLPARPRAWWTRPRARLVAPEPPR